MKNCQEVDKQTVWFREIMFVFCDHDFKWWLEQATNMKHPPKFQLVLLCQFNFPAGVPKTPSKWVAKPLNGSELAHGHVILLLDFSFFFYLYNLNFINFYVSWITNTSHKFHNHKQDTTTKHKLQSWPKPRIHYLISHLQISNAHLNSFSLKRQKKKKKDHFGLNPIFFFIISKQMLYFYNFFF